MATPGVSRRAQAASEVLRISDGTRVIDLQTANLGPREDRLVRKEAGFTLPQLTDSDSFDGYSLCVLWWIARVREGEDVTLDDILDEYPTYGHLEGFTVERITDDEDGDRNPEG
jgi:hypothetical protein